MYGYHTFHENLMEKLIDSVHKGKESHAYIFEGNKGLGLLAAAGLFAAALVCDNSRIAPCGACQRCIESKADTNPDIVYPKPEANRKSFGAKDMRKLEEDVEIKPFAAQKKVYIFEDASLLTEAAQNVLLKTLEEPPAYAAFIIITENADMLLQTIRSRSVIIHFPNVSDNVVRSYINEKYPQVTDRLEFLVKYCEGVPYKADEVMNDESFDALRNSSLEMLPSLLSDKTLNAFTIQEYLSENKDSANKIFEFWLSYLRDILLLQTGAYDSVINMDKKGDLRNISAREEPKKITELIDRLVTAEKMTARYVNLKGIAYWLAIK